MGNWDDLPRIDIFNPKITQSAQSGYYIVYLFKENMEGVYLSLNQGVTDYKDRYGNKAIEILINNSKNFREKIDGKSTFSEELLKSLSLGTGNYAPFYEAGNIYAKYYSLDDLPSEDILISDLTEFLELYNHLVNNNSQIGIRDFIITVLEKYLEAKNDEKLAKELITKYANKSDFQKYLAKIANQTIKGNLDTYGYFGAANSLILIPRVDIFDRNSSSPYFIRFSFREDMKGVYLSLTDNYRRFEKIMAIKA